VTLEYRLPTVGIRVYPCSLTVAAVWAKFVDAGYLSVSLQILCCSAYSLS